jgi:hypothetical protein
MAGAYAESRNVFMKTLWLSVLFVLLIGCKTNETARAQVDDLQILAATCRLNDYTNYLRDCFRYTLGLVLYLGRVNNPGQGFALPCQ